MPNSFSIKNKLTQTNKVNNQVLTIKMNESLNSIDDYSLLTFYIVSQILFIELDIPLITGSMISNIELYDGFDASEVIGDTHSTFPILNLRGQNYSDFCRESLKMKKRYEEGLNIRDIIFSDIENNSQRKEILKKRWEEMNFSVNYVGGTLNPEEKIDTLYRENYGDKYLLAFTSNDYLYILLPRGLFLQESTYFIERYKVNVKNF